MKKKQTPDLEYVDYGLFTMFYPNTEQGRKAWNELATITDGTGKVLTWQANDIITRLRLAGYSVEKQKQSVQTFDNLLDELMK